MKYFYFVLCVLFFSCSSKEKLTSKKVLANSIKKHDPNNNWNTSLYKLRIQEPRVQNSIRFSNVMLDTKTGAFSLERNRDSFISKHSIDKNGNAKTLLNGVISKDSILIKKYRLDPKRNSGYKRYYEFFSLLPMSLQNEKYNLKDDVTEVIYNDRNALKITLELEKPFFSKDWNLYFSAKDFTFLGVEMFFLDDAKKGERIFFDGEIIINDVSISRFHHWYEIDGTYSGSDIIVKELK